jgi:CBS domain-containing membrane protein
VAGDEYHGFHKLLIDRLGVTGGEATYTFVACLISLAVSGMAAYLFGQPLFFPSLGPTAFLFFEQPMAKTSSPRNTLIGHLVAILAGAVSLAIFGLLGHPSILAEGVTLARVGAGTLSPTGATTLIVSLGLLQTPREMTMLMVGVMLLTVVGWTINRILGVPMPVWSSGE